MPRFFFHVYSDEVSLDAEGTELVGIGEAQERAEQAVRDLACREVSEGHLGLSHRIEVADQEGAEVLTVRLQDVVQIHP